MYKTMSTFNRNHQIWNDPSLLSFWLRPYIGNHSVYDTTDTTQFRPTMSSCILCASPKNYFFFTCEGSFFSVTITVIMSSLVRYSLIAHDRPTYMYMYFTFYSSDNSTTSTTKSGSRLYELWLRRGLVRIIRLNVQSQVVALGLYVDTSRYNFASFHLWIAY